MYLFVEKTVQMQDTFRAISNTVGRHSLGLQSLAGGGGGTGVPWYLIFDWGGGGDIWYLIGGGGVWYMISDFLARYLIFFANAWYYRQNSYDHNFDHNKTMSIVVDMIDIATYGVSGR